MKKKVTIFLLQISMVVMGFTFLIESVDATKKDGGRALELLKQARAAIGGESAVNGVQNLSAKGRTIRVIKTKDQADKEVNGEFQLALALPDNILRMESFNFGDGEPSAVWNKENGGEPIIIQEDNVKFVGKETTKDAVIERDGHDNNEFVRYMLGFLLTAPQNSKLEYDYAGEENLDGKATNVIVVQSQGGQIMRLYLDKQTSQPVMMSYKGFVPPQMPLFDKVEGIVDIKRRVPAPKGENPDAKEDVVIVRVPQGGAHPELKEKRVFKIEGNPEELKGKEPFQIFIGEPVEAEIQLRFSDYRSVNGVLLPHKLTQYVNGSLDQMMNVDSYEINSQSTTELFNKGNIRVVRRKNR